MLPGTEIFGHSFEHMIIQELIAFLGYTQSTETITNWRTSSGYEVDAIIGNGRIAIEIKSTDEVKSRHLKGLKAFKEDFSKARAIIVSLDKYPRVMNGVEIIPGEQFLKAKPHKTFVILKNGSHLVLRSVRRYLRDMLSGWAKIKNSGKTRKNIKKNRM